MTVITSGRGVYGSSSASSRAQKTYRNTENDSALELEKFSRELTEMGYERCAQVEASASIPSGAGILDIFPLTEENPWRVELWGDEIDSIRSFDVESQRSIENLEEITIYPATEEIGREEKGFFQKLTDTFLDYFPEDSRIFLDEPEGFWKAQKRCLTNIGECMVHRMEKGQAAPKRETGFCPRSSFPMS